jgi:hypothetical protein
MVAGMTPSTVKAGFVSAILSAGFHVELAGGGHYSPDAIRAKVAEIQSQIPAGVGITLNSLYINPRQFTFQLPLWQEMRKEGLPIEGFCVAAGIPSTEKAVEIIDGLKQAGIKHVAFKSKGSDKSSVSPRRTPASPLFSSGLVDVPAATIHTRTSTSLSSPRIGLSGNTRIFLSSQVLVSVPPITSGPT